jgi:peptidoglycan/xylan/chitin deacetylase (PgdA/CDA1 family)
MRASSASRLRRAVRYLCHRFRASGVILVYHRVAALQSDPWDLAVTPANFAEHLEVLRRLGVCLPLARFADATSEGTLPGNAVAVTFDDGYADNLLHALPLLERYDVPATLFATTRFVGGRREAWWDELEHLLLHPRELPSELTLELGGRVRTWTLDGAEYDHAASARCRTWKGKAPPPTARHALFQALYHLLADMPAEARERVLDTLWVWAGDSPCYRDSHRALTLEELSLAARSGLIEIGAHTVTHPRLPTLAPPAQERELRQSKAELEAVVGRPVESFAYPHGAYDARTRAIAQEVGFRRACSASERMVPRRPDLFALPRVNVEDCDGEEFEQRIRWHLAYRAARPACGRPAYH